MDDQQTHADALRALADRFSEGWYDGIKIDSSDVMDLSAAACELEALRKDAERYRWLRDRLLVGEIAEAAHYTNCEDQAGVDAAIDRELALHNA